MLHSNLTTNERGHLCLAGRDVCDLADKYSTPLFLMDEERIRNNCRTYINAMKEFFPWGSRPLFASKSCCFKRIYEIMVEEGMGIDLVSPGELYIAKEAGFPLENS